jgi:hypothetical protein
MRRACAVLTAEPPSSSGRRAAAVDRIVAVIATLGRLPVLRGTCLSRAVVALVLARRAGLDPALVIGISRSGSSLSAHAWLEHAGRIVPDQDIDGYVPLWSSR